MQSANFKPYKYKENSLKLQIPFYTVGLNLYHKLKWFKTIKKTSKTCISCENGCRIYKICRQLCRSLFYALI